MGASCVLTLIEIVALIAAFEVVWKIRTACSDVSSTIEWIRE
ncbi:MAG: hypothetical protein P8H90_06730 [Tateyamaria sp.]|nr:hypothetical protein [Tateyamaria sp.]MDG1419759.1 hypothetical protein [Tateyamaria sp.]MDG1678847.1 hypothetical protein [Tateyamaria sp.]